MAALAPLVFQAAAEGDRWPDHRATPPRDLAELVASLLAALYGGAADSVALAGGNLAPGRALRAPLSRSLKKQSRLIRAGTRPLEPAEGALALAPPGYLAAASLAGRSRLCRIP